MTHRTTDNKKTHTPTKKKKKLNTIHWVNKLPPLEQYYDTIKPGVKPINNEQPYYHDEEEDYHSEEKQEEEEQKEEKEQTEEEKELTLSFIKKQIKLIQKNKDNGDNYPILPSFLVPPDTKDTSVQAAKKRRQLYFKECQIKINKSKKIKPTKQVFSFILF